MRKFLYIFLSVFLSLNVTNEVFAKTTSCAVLDCNEHDCQVCCYGQHPEASPITSGCDMDHVCHCTV